MNKLEDMTDEELKHNFKALEFCINELECYGVKDLVHYQGVIKELETREYQVRTKAKVTRS